MKDFIQKRPSVHLLCYGCYLQAPVKMSDSEAIVPLQPLGFDTPVKWLAMYAKECGAGVDEAGVQLLVGQGKDANPCIAIVITLDEWNSPEAAESSVQDRLERLRALVSWATGNHVEPFGYLTLGPEKSESYFRLLPPKNRSRIRLGFGNTGEDFARSITSILKRADSDEHFSFVLSMVHDANYERNVRFQIARYFSCLEALAYKIKKGRGARDAVRQLLGLEKGRTGQVSVGERKYDYDVVLGAGVLRDLLYHGVPLDFSKAKPEEKDTFDLISAHPETVASDLRSRVEMEIMRWSTGVSNGQTEYNSL